MLFLTAAKQLAIMSYGTGIGNIPNCQQVWRLLAPVLCGNAGLQQCCLVLALLFVWTRCESRSLNKRLQGKKKACLFQVGSVLQRVSQCLSPALGPAQLLGERGSARAAEGRDGGFGGEAKPLPC